MRQRKLRNCIVRSFLATYRLGSKHNLRAGTGLLIAGNGGSALARRSKNASIKKRPGLIAGGSGDDRHSPQRYTGASSDLPSLEVHETVRGDAHTNQQDLLNVVFSIKDTVRRGISAPGSRRPT